jgi:acetyl-CoA carboxylase beta subunit
MGASSGATNGRKIGHMKRVATSRGLPIVFLGESSGARMPDHMGARGMGALLGNDPTQYARMRETPWASATLGLSYGSSSWYAVLSDFCVLRKGAVLAVSSAQLASLAIKEEVDPQVMGGWQVHAEVTGFADYIAETDEEALQAIRTFLSYLPSHHKEAPPVHPVPEGSGAKMADIAKLLPERRTQVYDVRNIIRAFVDAGSFFELKPRFAKVAVTGLARLDGRTVGIVANNPLSRGGAMDTDACEKITSFLVLCDSFNTPIVMLVDNPGFSIGVEAERRRAPGKIMNFMQALQLCTVPKISIIPAQELRPGLSQHGRRPELRRGGGLAQCRGELHGSHLRGEDRARPVARRARLRRGLRADEQGQRGLGDRCDLRRAVRHPAARDPGLPHPHARSSPPASDQRRRRAPDACLADEFLGTAMSTHTTRRLDRSLAQRGVAERPSLYDLAAMGGEKVSPLRALRRSGRDDGESTSPSASGWPAWSTRTRSRRLAP